MKSAFLFLLRAYKKFISPLLPPACRFYPTCSEYMAEAIQKHGPFWGLILGIYRLLRCQPLCKGGYDPVPETIRFPWRKPYGSGASPRRKCEK